MYSFNEKHYARPRWNALRVFSITILYNVVWPAYPINLCYRIKDFSQQFFYFLGQLNLSIMFAHQRLCPRFRLRKTNRPHNTTHRSKVMTIQLFLFCSPQISFILFTLYRPSVPFCDILSTYRPYLISVSMNLMVV